MSKKKNYKVTITEVLKMTVDVEAEDEREAEQIVSDRWRDSDYILDADDFDGVDYDVEYVERLRDDYDR